jgi:hypothetical protein
MRKILFALTACLFAAQAHATDVTFGKAAGKHPNLYDAMNDAEIRKPVAALIINERLPHWVKGIVKSNNYVTGPALVVTTPTPGATVYKACRSHNCAADRFEIMITPHQHHAFGLLRDGKELRFVGHPNEKAEAVLKAAISQ